MDNDTDWSVGVRPLAAGVAQIKGRNVQFEPGNTLPSSLFVNMK